MVQAAHSKMSVAAQVCLMCDHQAGTTSSTCRAQARLEPVPCHAAGVVLFHHLFDMKPGLLKLFPFKDSTGRPVDSVSACTLLAMECAHPRTVPLHCCTSREVHGVPAFGRCLAATLLPP